MARKRLSRKGIAIGAAVVLVIALAWGLSSRGSPDGEHTVPGGAASAGRGFILHTPNGRRSSQARPLVLVLHGWNQTPKQIAYVSRTNGVADKEGFDVVYPAGNHETWNAGGCCDGNKSNDVRFLTDVVDATAHLTKIDRRRVYVWGFSNGGMMAWRAACQRPDVFAAAGVVSGALFVPCTHAVRVRHIHGTDDPAVPYYGGKSSIPGLVVPNSALENKRVPRGSTVSTTLLPGWVHAWPLGVGAGRLNGSQALWDFDSRYRTAGTAKT